MTINHPTRRTAAKRTGQLFKPARLTLYFTAEHVRILNRYAAAQGITASEALRRNIALMVPGEYDIRQQGNPTSWIEQYNTLQAAMERCDELNRIARVTDQYYVRGGFSDLYPGRPVALQREIDRINREAFPVAAAPEGGE